MTLRFDEGVEVSPLTPENLRKVITDLIGASPSTYTQQKQSFLKNAGFEHGSHSMNFVVEGIESIQQLVSMSLGNGGSLSVKDVTTTATRFGISDSRPLIKSDTAIVEILKINPDSKGMIEFRFSKGTVIRYEADIYRGGLGDWVPDELKSLRIDTPLLEMTILVNSSTINLSLRLGSDASVELGEAIKLFKMAVILRSPQRFNLTITPAQMAPLKLNLTYTGSFADNSDALSALEKLQKIQTEFDYLDTLHIRLKEVWENDKTIDAIHGLVTNQFQAADCEFDIPGGPGSVENAHLLAATQLVIGNVIFVLIYAVIGDAKNSDADNYTLAAKEVVTIYKTVTTRSGEDEGQLHEALMGVVSDYECEHDGVTFEMITAFLALRKKWLNGETSRLDALNSDQ